MAYTGVYERTIYYNPVNKYSVISVKTSDRSIPEKARSAYRHRDNMIHFAAVGYELPRTDQVSMILDGEWKEGKNGFQLHVTQCEEIVPQTRDGIKGYLSSRLIKGIGGKTAELIVDRFGADTLNILENEPERLLEIRGVSKAKLEEIIASYNESRALRDLMLLLAPFQITPTTATKIYDHFGAHSMDILRDNPFELCQISGFAFKRVDAIMRKNNWPLNSPTQVRTDLPVSDIADLQRFDTVCTIAVQHMERQFRTIALKAEVAGVDHIILFDVLLSCDLRSQLFQRQACFHRSTLPPYQFSAMASSVMLAAMPSRSNTFRSRGQ